MFSVHIVRNLHGLHLGQILHGPFQIPEPGTPFVSSDPEPDLRIHFQCSLRDFIVVCGPEDIPADLSVLRIVISVPLVIFRGLSVKMLS